MGDFVLRQRERRWHGRARVAGCEGIHAGCGDRVGVGVEFCAMLVNSLRDCRGAGTPATGVIWFRIFSAARSGLGYCLMSLKGG